MHSLLKETRHANPHLQLPLHLLLLLQPVPKRARQHLRKKLQRERQRELHERYQHEDAHGNQSKHVRRRPQQLLPLAAGQRRSAEGASEYVTGGADVGGEELASHPEVLGFLDGEGFEFD